MVMEGGNDEFDDLDALLNDYDRTVDEILEAGDKPAQHQRRQDAPDRPPEELGIDTEVKVKQPRKLAPKLDETL
jgi:hypothetical protein